MSVRATIKTPGYNHPRYNPDDYNRRSAIGASPKLQLPIRKQLDEISDEVEGVIDVKKENFTPKTDVFVANLIQGAAAVVILVVAVFAALAASYATGAALGFAAAAGGVALLLGLATFGLGRYLASRAEDRTKDQEAVNLVHKAAIRNLASEKINEFDEEGEMASYPVYRGNRAAHRPHRPTAPRMFMPAEASAPAVHQADAQLLDQYNAYNPAS